MDRQCGQRKKGGTYLTVSTGPDGQPIEYFLLDPPEPINLAEFGLAPRGVHLIERKGVWHVCDVIGAKYYPNVWDFVAEGAAFGISRRAELPDYSNLTLSSRLLTIHKRAIIRNFAEIVAEMSLEERQRFECVRPFPPQHQIHKLNEMCCGLWRHDVSQMENEEKDGKRMRGSRKLNCWESYAGYRSVKIIPDYQYAIFGSFPLGPIEVIEDPDDRTHEGAMEKAQRSGLNVQLVKE